jgi:ABC-2 type transport system permease protein
MSGLGDNLSAFFAVVRRDFHIFLSYRTRLVSQILTSVFSLTLFYYVSRLVHVDGFTTPDRYFGFVVVGIALVGVLYSCFAVSETIRQELVAGTFERLLLSPFGGVRGAVATAIFPLLYSFVLSAVTLGLGAIIFGLQLHWSTVPLALPALILALLAFLPFGLFFSALTIATKQANVGATWVIALLSIVGGLYFPVALLPGWAQLAAEVQPFTPATELLRHLLVDAPMETSVGLALAKIVGFAEVLVPLSLFALYRAIRLGQHRGTIIEY